MSKSKLIYHIDDSTVARAAVAPVFNANIPGVELVQFESGSSVIQAMTDHAPIPWMIITDWNMPGMMGDQLLSWIKRNPRFHVAPVVLLSAELEEAQKQLLLNSGAFSLLKKPLRSEDLTSLIEKYSKQELPYDDLFELDNSFIEELKESLGSMKGLCKSLNAKQVQELYRRFHTVKGSAYSLQFPHFGHFMHLAEGFLNSLQKFKCESSPAAKRVLEKILKYVEEQAGHIQTKSLMALPSEELTSEIKLFSNNLTLGWLPEGFDQSTVASVPAAVTVVDEAEVQQSDSIRVKNTQLDELQKRLKKVIQLRLQLNTFANQLKQEFFDETFPNDLLKLVEGLQSASSEIMDFFIQLRVMPVTRLKQFCSQIASLASRQLNKPIEFEFSSEQGIEVDQAVMECLENSFTHLLKNAIDHGMESADVRLRRNKSEAGSLRVNIKRESGDFFAVSIQDDGGGIDGDALKAAVLKKGLINEESLIRLQSESIFELIFVDGLSTKQVVSELSGRGVGLSAVKDSITKLGGTIHVSSQLGQGTQFMIKLPRSFKL